MDVLWKQGAAWIHCRTCIKMRQPDPIEVAIGQGGLYIGCKIHGTIITYTPEILAKSLWNVPFCNHPDHDEEPKH